EVLKRLDGIAKSADMDRSKLIVNILDEASKSLEATKKVGILQFSVLLRNMGEWMNKWAENIRKKKNIDDFVTK
ncbi:hypothetical protein ACFL4N_08255, partial [Thermodesulfobacteriota bacterium]